MLGVINNLSYTDAKVLEHGKVYILNVHESILLEYQQTHYHHPYMFDNMIKNG